MSKQPQKKDKGKAIQKAEDYQLQVPVQNQFAPVGISASPIQTSRHKYYLVLLNK